MIQTETVYLWDKVAEETMHIPAVFYGEQSDMDKVVTATFTDEYQMKWWEQLLYLGRVRYRYTLTITDE